MDIIVKILQKTQEEKNIRRIIGKKIKDILWEINKRRSWGNRIMRLRM